MSSPCAILRNIESVSQIVADFLGNPAAFTSAVAADLSARIEAIRGAVRDLPLAVGPKNDLLRRLNEAQVILSTPGILTKVEQLLAVLQILQLSALKVKNRNLPCPPGQVKVFPSNRFSTICNSIC